MGKGSFPYFRSGVKHVGGLDGNRLAGELFEAAQLVASPLVAQQIAQVYARLESGNAEVSDLLRQLQDAQARRERIRKELDSGSLSENRRVEPRRRWDEINARIAELEVQVQSASPGYNQLVLFKPIPLSEVQRRLREDEALAHLLIGATGGVRFLVNRNGIEVYGIGLSRSEIRRFVHALRRPVEAEEIPVYPVERAHALYRQLLGPVESRVRAKDHLITIPMGDLLSLSFAMPVTDPPPAVEDLDYSAVPWMVTRHALTLAPAVQSCEPAQNAPVQSTETLCGLRRPRSRRQADDPDVGGEYATDRNLSR